MAEPAGEALARVAAALAAGGLNHGASGNVSVREGERFLITPSGVEAPALGPAHMVSVGLDGTLEGEWLPSSEWRMHLGIYRARPRTAAIVHAHPPFATALACAHLEIPAFHYMVAAAGGDSVPLAPYATFGTQALCEHVVAALHDRDACLLANHGMVAGGGDLDAAHRLAEAVEQLARVYLLTRAAGEPRVLDAAQMADVLERFRDYGQQPDRG